MVVSTNQVSYRPGAPIQFSVAVGNIFGRPAIGMPVVVTDPVLGVCRIAGATGLNGMLVYQLPLGSNRTGVFNFTFTAGNVRAPVMIDVQDPRVLAMLDTIAWAEATGGNYAKMVNGVVIASPFYPSLLGQANVSIPSFSRYPAITVRVSPTIMSTAAGRYQFLQGTWAQLAPALGLPDFSPTSQDIAAVQLMKRAGMINFLLAGQVQQAIYAGSPVWASLPMANGRSFYSGQPAQNIGGLLAVYQIALAQRSR